MRAAALSESSAPPRTRRSHRKSVYGAELVAAALVRKGEGRRRRRSIRGRLKNVPKAVNNIRISRCRLLECIGDDGGEGTRRGTLQVRSLICVRVASGHLEQRGNGSLTTSS